MSKPGFQAPPRKERAVHLVRPVARLSPAERLRREKALELLAGGGVLALAGGDVELAGLGVYEALLARGWALRHRSAAEMLPLARAAVEVSRGLGSRRLGASVVADLQARAWGELGNAYRVADRLDRAALSFGKAFVRLAKGTGDPLLEAWLLDLESSLLGTLRETGLALRQLALVRGLYRSLGEIHMAGRTLVTQALYTFYGGDVDEAVRLNGKGLLLLDRRREPDLVAGAVRNQLVFLAARARRSRASRRLSGAR